jgi:hypothetical protein
VGKKAASPIGSFYVSDSRASTKPGSGFNAG